MPASYQIVCEDAFRWLENRRARSIHAVVTDPPFGIVEFSANELAKARSGRGGIWRLPQGFDGYARKAMPRFTVLGPEHRAAIRAFYIHLAALLFKVAVPGAHIVVASQSVLSYLVAGAFADAGFEVRGHVIRVVQTLRGGDRPKNGHVQFPDLSVTPRSCWEPWLVFRSPVQGRVVDNLRNWGTGALSRPERDVPFKDLIESSTVRGAERTIAAHPAAKPQAFMRQIVRAVRPLGAGVLLDPFMGSGTTIAAADALGVPSIGIEKDRTYFTLAKRVIPKLAQLQIDVQPRLRRPWRPRARRAPQPR